MEPLDILVAAQEVEHMEEVHPAAQVAVGEVEVIVV